MDSAATLVIVILSAFSGSATTSVAVPVKDWSLCIQEQKRLSADHIKAFCVQTDWVKP